MQTVAFLFDLVLWTTLLTLSDTVTVILCYLNGSDSSLYFRTLNFMEIQLLALSRITIFLPVVLVALSWQYSFSDSRRRWFNAAYGIYIPLYFYLLHAYEFNESRYVDDIPQALGLAIPVVLYEVGLAWTRKRRPDAL
jgi:hypothetical protein